MQRKLIFISLMIVLFLGGCDGISLTGSAKTPSADEEFIAVVWNVQALFDGEDAGNEFAEYRTAAGWTQEKYAARLLAISQAIIQMRSLATAQQESDIQQVNTLRPAAASGTVPDLIGLVELENADVLEDLVQGPLAKQGYVHTFFGNLPGMSLGLGVLSRYPLTQTIVHSITVKNETTPRPIVEVHLEPQGKPLIFMICHWKSKVGSEDATEALRRASARVIRRRLQELREEKPDTPVIIMGDLNENHDEFFRRKGNILSALLPDDPKAAQLVQTKNNSNDFLIVSQEKPPRTEYFDTSFPVLYTPWENELLDGSYYYKNNWETIDHVLVTEQLFDNKDWEYNACRVLNMQPFTNSKGLPYSYIPRYGSGLSDHLPLMLFLRMEGQR